MVSLDSNKSGTCSRVLCPHTDLRLSKAIHDARKQVKEKEADLLALEMSVGPNLVSEFKEWDKQNPGVEKYSSHYKDIKRKCFP